MAPPKILFVCLGNICRSPTAEAVFRHRAARASIEVEIDSSGTGAWHQGERPDPRAIEAGEARGYSFAGQTARQVERNDFTTFDYVLAMDDQNLSALQEMKPPAARAVVKRFLDYAPHVTHRNVPDPYYGGANGFETVLDLIEAASDGLLETLSDPSR